MLNALKESMTDTQTPRLRLALFDLDHTLLPLDSDYEVGRVHHSPRLERPGGVCPPQRRVLCPLPGRHARCARLRTLRHRAVRLQGPEAAAAAHAQFMREVIAPAIRPQALDLIRQHQAAGITCSSSRQPTNLSPVPSPRRWAWRNCWPCNWRAMRKAGTPVKSMAFRPCARARCCAWNNGWPTASWAGDVESTFCSDSMNDVPLLEKVDHPVATNPDPRLRALAQERGWRILDLFADDASAATAGA